VLLSGGKLFRKIDLNNILGFQETMSNADCDDDNDKEND
jgi:hypothetical protein